MNTMVSTSVRYTEKFSYSYEKRDINALEVTLRIEVSIFGLQASG